MVVVTAHTLYTITLFFELLSTQFALPVAHTKLPVLTHSLFSLMLFLSECLRQHCQPLSRQPYVDLVGFACPPFERLYDVIWYPLRCCCCSHSDPKRVPRERIGLDPASVEHSPEERNELRRRKGFPWSQEKHWASGPWPLSQVAQHCQHWSQFRPGCSQEHRSAHVKLVGLWQFYPNLHQGRPLLAV